MQTKSQSTGKFSHQVETEPKTGWKIAVLRYEDPNPERNLEARIAPDAGSNLYSLKAGGTELLVQPPEMPALVGSRYGFPILYPTPNRVRDAHFTFDGVTYSFTPNNGKNFIHGLVHSLKWQSGALSSDKRGATLQTWLDWDPALPSYKLFPIKHKLTMTYRLTNKGVRMDFNVENKDDKRLPFGFAFHPWFQILGSRAGTYVCVPAQKHMENVDLLPTGKLQDLEGMPWDLRKPVSLEEAKLDDVFWGMTPDRIPWYEAKDKGIKVTLGASKEFTHMIVYSPPGRPLFCMENQTCSTDAHNMFNKGFKKESHLLIADKGKSVKGWVMVGINKGP
ncbi:MAG TPA: aldose 1-epimerase [Acidobacteriota bacterium]|jgi:aldose 1-epimerase